MSATVCEASPDTTYLEAEPDPEELMQQVQEGSQDAEEGLYRQLAPEVYRHMLSKARNPEDAADLTQATFERVHRYNSTYVPGSARAWTHRIAANLFLSDWRRTQHIKIEPIDFELPENARHIERDSIISGAQSQGEVAFEGVEESEFLTSLQSLIPAMHLAAMVSHDVIGMSYEEIAATQEIPIGTVQSRIHRGRRKLRKLYENGTLEMPAHYKKITTA